MRLPHPLPTLLTIALAPPANAQAAQHLHPGPALVFTTIETVDVTRREIVHLAEIEGSQVYELHRGRLAARVLQRLDRDHVLLSQREPAGLVVVHVPSGSRHTLAEGRSRFVGQHGERVLFQDRAAGDGPLLHVDWRDPDAPAPVTEARFSSVPLIAGNIAFGLTARHREVWLASLTTGRARRVATIPNGHTRPRLALSPGGTRLAVSAVDRGRRGWLQVVDVATGEALQTWKGLPIFLSVDSSGSPALEIAFQDDEHIAWSESRGNPRGMAGNFVWITRSLADDELVDEVVYGNLGSYHQRPVFEPPQPRYEIARGGESSELRTMTGDVLATVPRQREQYEDVAVSRPAGRFATARLGDNREFLTLFRPDSEPRRLSTSWAYGLLWLRAAR